ncbi:MAG: NAD(P)-binding domain-containing protein [Cyanobacteria bacterium J06638_22]
MKIAIFGAGNVGSALVQRWIKAKHQIAELGFEALDAGLLTKARLIEPFAMLWIKLAFVYGQGRELAFDLLRR